MKKQTKKALARFQPRPEEKKANPWDVTLPVNEQWDGYARQSSVQQLLYNQESTEMQRDDMRLWAIKRGVNPDKITVFEADLGISGTLPIAERTDLQEIVHRIEQGLTKVVFCMNVSRLFRDETRVQYTMFANTCKEHGCLVVTVFPEMVFNFSNDMMYNQFIYLAQQAADFIKQFKAVSLPARKRKAEKGFYVGTGPIHIGYIVDYDMHSPTYRKFIVYEPHAEVVRYIFKRYFELSGNIYALCKELQEKQALFDDFPALTDQRILSRFKRRKVAEGYRLSRHGVELLLQNPVYLGWWMVDGVLIRKDNHEAILQGEDERYFWYAFNRLADFTVDGAENENKVRERAKYYQKDTTKQRTALLKDRITSESGKVTVHVRYDTPRYTILPNERTSLVIEDRTEIAGRLIDTPFLQFLFTHLREARDLDNYRDFLEVTENRHNQKVTDIQKELKQTIEQQKKIVENMKIVTAKALVMDMNTEYELLEARKTKLLKQQKEVLAYGRKLTVQDLADFQTEVGKLIDVWEKKPFQLRLDLVNALVEKASIDVVATHWIQLTVHWTHPAWQADSVFIYRNRGKAPFWDEEERTIVREHFPKTARETLQQMLPGKSWQAIRKEANKQKVTRDFFTHSDIPEQVSWIDYEFLQKLGIEPKEMKQFMQLDESYLVEVQTGDDSHDRWHILRLSKHKPPWVNYH